MKTNRVTRILAGLSFIGALISLYQTAHFHQVRSGLSALGSFCNFGSFNCDAVSLSAWSELLPSVPLSALALGFYIVLIVMLFSPSLKKEESTFHGLITLMSLAAFGTSTFYLVIMIAVIQAGCLLCLSIDLINLTLLLLSLLFLKPKNFKLGRLFQVHKKLWGIMGVLIIASLALGSIIGKDPSQRIPSEDIEDYVNRILNSPIETVALPPDLPYMGTAPSEAKVVIVKFFDYECPSCRVAAESLHPIIMRYAKKGVSFVYRNYPLDSACNPDIKRPMHPWACEAARLALCGQELGAFDRVYETLFRDQSELSPQTVRPTVEALFKDTAPLTACLQNPKTAVRLARDLEEAQRLKIESTPTFFVNGRRVAGAYPTPVWEALLNRLLKEH